jgi:RHS repeat-associated protein
VTGVDLQHDPALAHLGADAFLHADGILAQIDRAGTAEYMLDDALGSVRGVTDLAGMLTGAADYDVFGTVRQSSGASSVFRFTGEQLDSETGFTFLRARYLNPTLGRFTSADSVRPNASGTQGYNFYSYVANNPMTWEDPSGHQAAQALAFDQGMVDSTALIIARPLIMGTVETLCAAIAGEAALAGAFGGVDLALPAAGNFFAVCAVTATSVVTAGVLACALIPECREPAFERAKIIAEQSSFGSVSDTITFEKLKKWLLMWPLTPLDEVSNLLDALTDVAIRILPDAATRAYCAWMFAQCGVNRCSSQHRAQGLAVGASTQIQQGGAGERPTGPLREPHPADAEGGVHWDPHPEGAQGAWVPGFPGGPLPTPGTDHIIRRKTGPESLASIRDWAGAAGPVRLVSLHIGDRR